MKNIPIIGNFLLILSGFGVFTLAVAVYVSGQMWWIDSSYTALGSGPEAAAMDVAQANRAQATARRSIADMMISITDAQNQAANHDLQATRKDFIDYLEHAAKAGPANAADYEALKARGLEILDQTCAATIKAGMAANNQAAAVASQTLYLKDCAPAFPALAADMKKKAKDVIV